MEIPENTEVSQKVNSIEKSDEKPKRKYTRKVKVNEPMENQTDETPREFGNASREQPQNNLREHSNTSQGYSKEDLEQIGLAFVKRISSKSENEVKRENENNETLNDNKIPTETKPKRQPSKKQLENFELMMKKKQEINEMKRREKELEKELKLKLKEKKLEHKKVLDLKNLSTSVRIEKLKQEIDKYEEKTQQTESEIAKHLSTLRKKPTTTNNNNQVSSATVKTPTQARLMSREEIMRMYGL